MPQLTDPERYDLADNRLLAMLQDESWGAWLNAMIGTGVMISVVLDSEQTVAAVTRAWRHNGGKLPGVWAVDVPGRVLPVLVELVPLTTSERPPVLARRWGDVSGVTLYSAYPLVADVLAMLEAKNGW